MQKTAKPVYIEPSKNGKISTAGRRQIATINGKEKSIVEKAQDVLATRGIQSHKKVPKLKKKRVPIKPSEDGSINMAGRQKAAPINGKGSYNPSWSDFVTAGSIVFPNFYEKPLDARAVNQYKGVLFYSSSTPTVKSTRFQRIRRKCSQCSRLGFPMS